MNGSNKILTVSYGTFSCTLEGFEDPFNSMRSIAEYFRDLAADDRYFGAEPPTPDVEMLQALAARGTGGQVSARLSDNGVALSVESEGGASGQDTAPLTIDDGFTSDEPEDALVLGDDASDADGPVESIADKLSRIRAVVSRQQTPISHEEFVEDDNAPEPPRSRALTRTLSDIAADIAGDEADPTVAEDAAVSSAGEEESDEDWSMLEETSSADDDTAEEAWDEPILQEATAAVLGDGETPKTGEGEASLSAAQDEFAAEISDDHTHIPNLADEDLSDDLAEDEDDVRDDIRAKAAQFAIEVSDDAPSDEPGASDVEVENRDEAFEAVVTDPEPEAFFSPRDEDATVEEADAQPTEYAESAMGLDEAQDDVESLTDTDPADEATRRRESRLLEPVDEDEAGVGRLMNEAEGKLADDDSIRRRRVISQMRAAVAATRADRILSRVSTQRPAEPVEKPYRRDLDRAVSEPRKSTPLVLVSAQRVAEHETTRPHPSVEDKEMRGDGDTGRAEPSAATDSNDFARFVEDMDAQDLPDLLEAAAAYAAFVEGQPHFSRPDLMRRVAAQASDLHMSREQGLRSFGQLLREGKIRKLQRGQFTIDEATRFNPAHRIAGE